MKSHPIVIDYSKYPFLVTPSEYLRSIGREGVSLADLVRVGESRAILRAYERIETSIVKGEIRESKKRLTIEDEVLAYHLSIILLSLVGDRWLTRRYAEAEGKRVERELLKEPLETLLSVGGRLGLRLSYADNPAKYPSRISRSGRISYEELVFHIPIVDYLKATRLVDEPFWKLENQVVNSGTVYLSRRKAARLIAEVVTDKIEESIVYVKEVPSELKIWVDKIRGLLKEHRGMAYLEEGAERLETVDIGVHPEYFPPCIRELYEKALSGTSLPHHGRFALATFLLRVGAGVDQVVEVFSKMPDFNEQKTRYQVEHLAGVKGSKTKYMTYNCETMRTLGLCVEDCGGKNPLAVYVRRYLAASRTRKRSSRTR